MNNFLKLGLRSFSRKLWNSNKYLLKPSVSETLLLPGTSRALWHMCSSAKFNGDFLKSRSPSELCQCGCSGSSCTGGERELVKYLQSEISEEKKALKMKSLPAEVDGFVISSDQAELTFKKQNELETIVVSLNVNHSVNSEEVGDGDDYAEELKAKPSFEVDIVRNNKTLNFACSFIEFEEMKSKDADIFEINEITYFEGEWQDKSYSVAADLLDENLYDLFMTVLYEKGVNDKFIEKVSEISTFYEHSQYIGLLENLKKFTSAN